MTLIANEAIDVVIVGGGIAGNALAAVLARNGIDVMVLERSAVYRDRVRGEYLQPWGVAEAQRLGLYKVLLASRAVHHTRLVPYDETLEPADAEATATRLDEVLPGVPGTLGLSHPAACNLLGEAASVAGAQLRRGVQTVRVDNGPSPAVIYKQDGIEQVVRCRLIIGADGRASGIRKQAGIPLHETPARLLGAGLLVQGVYGWPSERASIGTEHDSVFFIIPQGDSNARLYLMFPTVYRERFRGTQAAQNFIGTFPLKCVPDSRSVAESQPAGPCAVFPMNDSWTENTVRGAIVLIGDAAGYSDPHIGQGLSIALRDVRILSEILVSTHNWSLKNLQPYIEERSERMRRLRIGNDLATTLRGEFGPEARARRIEARRRMQSQPELAMWRRAMLAGPETVPESAFGSSVREQLFGP